MATPSLVRMKYEMFPLGSIQPNGWMRDQLRLCGQGLGGKLFHFYRFVKNSTWLGGTWEYSTLNEAAPYWYNYIVPLAFSLDRSEDEALIRELKDQAEQFLNYTLEHQCEDGWLGPESTRQTRGIWARCLLLQGLMNHAIADASKRPVIVAAILRFVRLVAAMLKNDYEGYLPKEGDKFDKQWFGVVRAHELSTTLQWLYDEPEASKDQETIWDAMEMLWEGSRLAKRDWTVFFADQNFPRTPSERHKSPNFQHGVNLAQGLRYPSQLYRMHPTPELVNLCKEAVGRAFDYHGTPSGTLTSDEYIGGLSPKRGSELCCSVELIFSLAYLHRLLGDNDLADRADLAAHNALPAAISSDWFSHQYVTQINQPWAQELPLEKDEKTPYYDVCRYANVFGLEPEFPCCTVNHPTAYPKLLMNAFLRAPNSPKNKPCPAILHTYLVPSRLQTDGISVSCQTNYPFVPCATIYTISTAEPFEFFIRVPGWATASSLIEYGEDWSNGAPQSQEFVPNDDSFEGFHRIHIPPSKTYKIAVTMHADINIQHHENKTISVQYGPLLFAHAISFEETTRLPRNYKDQISECSEVANAEGSAGSMSRVRDHDLLPTSTWNIAIDPTKETKLIAEDPWADKAQNEIRELPNPVWSRGASPVYIEVSAIEVDWPIRNGTAADPSEVDTSSGSLRGKSFRTKLAPYGTAKLHIAQFPTVNL